jgi:hypothetical protein
VSTVPDGRRHPLRVTSYSSLSMGDPAGVNLLTATIAPSGISDAASSAVSDVLF